MRHAGSEALDGIEPLLVRLHAVPGLVERNRGVFYRGQKAFLHFHEDPSGIYVDVRLRQDFERMRTTEPEEQDRLVALVTGALGDRAAERNS